MIYGMFIFTKKNCEVSNTIKYETKIIKALITWKLNYNHHTKPIQKIQKKRKDKLN